MDIILTSTVIIALILGFSFVFILTAPLVFLIYLLIRSRPIVKEKEDDDPIVGCIDYDNDPDMDLIL